MDDRWTRTRSSAAHLHSEKTVCGTEVRHYRRTFAPLVPGADRCAVPRHEVLRLVSLGEEMAAVEHAVQPDSTHGARYGFVIAHGARPGRFVLVDQCCGVGLHQRYFQSPVDDPRG